MKGMLSRTLIKNRRTFQEYNKFRKQIFTELAPKESVYVLFLLPWLLSINHRSFPGYVKNLRKPFKVYNIDNEREIIRREETFKKIFQFDGREPLRPISQEICWIQGVYTIGSIGTVSQTSRSDCDIWICIDKRDFDDTLFGQLNQKINLIKDWFDSQQRIPVYFFINDVEDIRNCVFGEVKQESSGSTQRNILKEEFYRTFILICGKIPLWWLAYEEGNEVGYEEWLREIEEKRPEYDDVIDLGDLPGVRREEYFGAAIWQYNKALTHPLKSLLKMLLLKMQLDQTKGELLCHEFRRAVLGKKSDEPFIDPSLFTMNAVLDYAANSFERKTYEFIKKCFYLRYDIKLNARKITLKEKLAADLFKKHRLTLEEIHHLNEFSLWNLNEQIAFGTAIFDLLFKIYRDISPLAKGVISEVTEQDLTIIGRKLFVTLEKKPNKIPIFLKPLEEMNLSSLIFKFYGRNWQVATTGDFAHPLVTHSNIVYCIAYLVWNGFYERNLIRMLPNPTTVTTQEIINLAEMVKHVFGTYNIANIGMENFLEEEKYIRVLLVVGFEDIHGGYYMNDICLLYSNNWGELFVRKFTAFERLKAFLDKYRTKFFWKEMNYYIKRNSLYYEKVIERTKRIVAQILMPSMSL